MYIDSISNVIRHHDRTNAVGKEGAKKWIFCFYTASYFLHEGGGMTDIFFRTLCRQFSEEDLMAMRRIKE